MLHRQQAARDEQPFEAVAPDAVLRGTLTLPAGRAPVPALVVAHGAALGLGAAPIYTQLLEPVLGEGVAVLRYDRRGEGASTGDAGAATLDDLAEDLLACVRGLQERPGIRPDRVGLWGISQGGWVAALAAASDPSIAGIVAVSASGTGPAEQMEFAIDTTMRAAGYDQQAIEAALSARRLVGRWLDGECETGTAQAAIDSIRNEPWFPLAYLDDLDADTRETDRAWLQFDVRPALARISAPVLLVLGDRDRWVDTARSQEIWQAALVNAPLTVVTLPGAGHFPTLATDPDSIDLEESGPTHPAYVTHLRDWVRSVLLA